MPADPATRLGDLLAAAARDHAHRSPAPRGLPFFGLDHRSGSAVELLGALAGHGIFRKYELVLDLSAHLGMSSRWLAVMLGCTAVATAATVPEAAAARTLTRVAQLEDHVHHVATDPRTLPFTDAGFTNVWLVETLAFLPDPDAVLAEAFRVLRPGGHLAVQEPVSRTTTPPALPGATFAPAHTWAARFARAGFVDLAVRDVSGRAHEGAALLTSARDRLDGTLQAAGRTEPALAAAARERTFLSASLATGTLGLTHILARRP
jgi:SAM-dependent methyltransferase